MARGYKRYRVEGFPELKPEEGITTNHQLGLGFPKHPQDHDPHGTLKLLGPSLHSRFLKYEVLHEVIENGSWRYENQSINRLTAIKEMVIYRDPTTPYIYFFRKHYSAHFLKKLAEARRDFRAYERVIDLHKLTEEFSDRIKGGWFSNLKIRDVRTAAIFGERVTQSAEWSKYNTKGAATAVKINLVLDKGVALKFILSKDGSIAIHNNQNEREDLETLLELEGHINPFVSRDDVGITQ